MKSAVIEVVRQDAEVLFHRVFMGETITCFGEDGFGKYGRSDLPVAFSISGVQVEAEDLDPNSLTAIGIRVFLSLSGYDEAQYGGTIATDQNALISLKDLLKSGHVDPSSISWAPLQHQGKHHIALDFDLHKLDIL